MSETNMDDKFTEALRCLGHIYESRSDDWIEGEPRVRHVMKVFVQSGELKPICGLQGVGLGAPQLWLDSNCERCAEIEGLTPALTKRSLMLNLVNVLCDIEQQFLDAMYWNYHNRDKEPLNPDPDGELAKGWIENQIQLVSMLKRFEPTMKKHEGRFGWPMDFESPDDHG